jgi:hypothetical protein
MNRALRTLRTATEIGLAAYTAVMLVACSFQPGMALQTPADVYQILNMAPYTQPYAHQRWLPEGEVGKLLVEHGHTCAYASQAASESYIGIRVQDSVPLAANYDATVILNGWSAEYVDSDHHVMGLGSVIFNIQRQGDSLYWEAGGLISDDNGDDAYRWCYDYDVLMWPTDSSQFDMKAFHADPTGKLIFVDTGDQGSPEHSIPGKFKRPGTPDGIALPLPEGFAMAWNDDDHHILQMGFELGPQTTTAKRLKWTSSTVFKDDASDRAYRAAEAVTVLSGRGFSLSTPSTVMVENDDGSWSPRSNAADLAPHASVGCPNVQIGDHEHVYQLAIDGLHSRYAIPVLTGWSLRYSCSDQHVKHAAAWIEDYNYVRPSGTQPGTLFYTVHTNLADDDSIPGFIDGLEVSVLGVNLVRPIPPIIIGNPGVLIGGTIAQTAN